MMPLLTVIMAAAPISVAAPGLAGSGIEESRVRSLSEHLANGFKAVRVVSSRDIGTLLGIERQRQLLGCGEGSCIAELAGALGVDGVLLGDLTRIGNTVQVSVKIIASKDGRRLASFAERTDDEAALFAMLERAAVALERETLRALGRADAAPGALTKGWALVPALATLAFAGVGTGLQLSAASDYRLLRERTAPMDQRAPLQLRDEGALKQTFAFVSFGLAAASAVTAVLLFVLGEPGPEPVSVGLTGEGSFVLSGRW